MDVEEKIKFKTLLKNICIDVFKKRIAAAEFVVQQAQDSANSDEKSSAGDKHETGRAHGQNDREMNERQLSEAKRELQLAESINADKIYDSFVKGAVAICGEEIYFMSVGLGKTEIEHKKVFLISPDAPLSKLMFEKKSGDKIVFNEKEFLLMEVY